MRPKAPRILLTAILTLALSAAGLLALDARSTSKKEAAAQEFQRLVGGLGLGPAVDLSRCPFSFDPRLGRRCRESFHPIPGGNCFCPHHACSVFPCQVDRDANVP
jgi:hypothetical protein